jgi:oligoribonuclease
MAKQVSGKTETLYVWFDTEYSTLELEEARLLQVAALITNSKLKRVLPHDQDISLAIRISESESISPWVEEHLPELVKTCRSTEAVDLAEADDRLTAYVDAALDTLAGRGPETEKESPVLAGNSVQYDWRLAQRFLPRFSRTLHYRLLDVTALKLEWKRLRRKRNFGKENPADVRQYFPEADLSETISRHDAYYDVQASIAELAFYRLYLFR